MRTKASRKSTNKKHQKCLTSRKRARNSFHKAKVLQEWKEELSIARQLGFPRPYLKIERKKRWGMIDQPINFPLPKKRQGIQRSKRVQTYPCNGTMTRLLWNKVALILGILWPKHPPPTRVSSSAQCCQCQNQREWLSIHRSTASSLRNSKNLPNILIHWPCSSSPAKSVVDQQMLRAISKNKNSLLRLPARHLKKSPPYLLKKTALFSTTQNQCRYPEIADHAIRMTRAT